MTAEPSNLSRRQILQGVGAGAIALGTLSGSANAEDDGIPRDANGNSIPGFEPEKFDKTSSSVHVAQEGEWTPVSDRKIKVGIAGYGLCKFGAQFFYQNHPNVEVVAASDLDKGRCEALAKAIGAKRTYTSCEEMIKQDKNIEAVYIATDAPSHARLSIMALEHEKHVVCAVPSVYGWEAEKEAEALLQAVKKSGRKYMMNETSTFHADCYASRMQYQAGALGKIIYSEGEYWHDGIGTLGSYNPKTGKIDEHGWRRGLPPMWYPTHATAYYVSVTGGGRLVEVSCVGNESYYPVFKDGENQHRNRFGTEIALFKTSEGGMSRMGISWDMKNAHGEQGRCYGQKPPDKEVMTARPALPPSVGQGGHGGSHGRLTNDFIESILLDRKPIVDVSEALNMTMAGVVAHQSALKEGEWVKVPQYNLS
jgi:predicted dehydrogenase